MLFVYDYTKIQRATRKQYLPVLIDNISRSDANFTDNVDNEIPFPPTMKFPVGRRDVLAAAGRDFNK